MATPNDGEKSDVLDLLYEGGDESGLDEAGRRSEHYPVMRKYL